MEVNDDISVQTTMTPTSDTNYIEINLTVCPTTGGQFQISVSPEETVENLRKKIGRRLQVPFERLNLLYKEKVLADGKVTDHRIQDGSKVTLLPAVESGFSSTVQGTQQSIIQAIESLSDAQIDDFLSGRSPLTLALRVGDHIMFVQLQLEQSTHPPPISDSFSHLTASSCPQQHRCENSFSHTSQSKNSSSEILRRQARDIAKSSTAAADNVTEKGSSSVSALRQCTDSSESTSFKHLATACTKISPSCAISTTSSSTTSNTSNNESVLYGRGQSDGNIHYRRPSTTCGKITSGVGPLSSHGTASGSRVARQMQRLRRLCGAHQQCVVYSNRELASEISSIVHAAKHLSGEQGSTGSSHRRTVKSSSRDRNKAAHNSPSQSANRTPTPGASIDSVTSHGPGIFSGTFSGSLHPNIQDSDGRPKRDPQTILQILTDLLSATNHYEGQTGNIGMLPQLFKEHFNKDAVSSTAITDLPQKKQDYKENSESKPQPSRRVASQRIQSREYPLRSQPSLPQLSLPSRFYPYQHFLPYADKSSPFWTAANATQIHQQLSNINVHSSKCRHSRSSCHASASFLTPSQSSTHHSNSRRSKKQGTVINVPRSLQFDQENLLTRCKMEALRREMQMKRFRRQHRRLACGPYQKRSDNVDMRVGSSSMELIKQSLAIDMDIDDIRSFSDERKKEVAHETAETVTV